MPGLPWGFTNTTTAAAGVVAKRYDGPGASARRAAEYAFFTALHGVLPVPRVLSAADDEELRTEQLPGAVATDAIEDGHADWIFHGAGALLIVLADNTHRLSGDGPVAVHGDYGPQNLLVDTNRRRITGLVDAEWSGRASDDFRHADAAWFEWIIRYHHRRLVPHLSAFYTGYGQLPQWSVRHGLMLRRCGEMIEFATGRDPASVAHWQERLADTRRFSAG